MGHCCAYVLSTIANKFNGAFPCELQTYCRIHQTIDIKLLAERLNMGIEAAEKWITNLILNARLNAKIDAKSGTVVMGTQSESVHEQLVEKSKQLSVRTFMLANTVVGTAR